ncbi:ROK family protein [Streptomyces sp. SID13666]|uniref:ROK family protein n=1 Tax=unclassified Streptomyces TaxID=2593676 RepID=UPI0013C0E29E|nr:MULTISPECIES: ROK family protein [unclassified Streptomyces]NEA53630.1 ROK family protein [Streptomyces sp. SID13666]NEA71408.1 ROK family protein [Streptomyces sp. SID13588]
MREGQDAGECVIALDVGGTGIKGALLDRELLLATVRRPTPRAAGPEAVVDVITETLQALARQARDEGLRVRRVGVVVPGHVDEDLSHAVYSANIGWRDLPLANLLERRTGLPVTLGHDVRAGGLAECVLGAARGARDVLFVAIGTGIAAAVISDGRPVRAGGHAGELGHVVVDPDGAKCQCGGRGCLETVASAVAIKAAFTARTGRTLQGADEVAALVAQGDADAVAVWDRAVDALASALATASSLLGPELVVLGGGLAQAGDTLLKPVRARLAQRLTFQRRPAVVRAALGDMAGCLGAGLYAWQAVDAATRGTSTGTGTGDGEFAMRGATVGSAGVGSR